MTVESSDDGAKKTKARLPINRSKESEAEVTPNGTTKFWNSTWEPGPTPSVIAACVGPDGAGTGKALAGELVPDWTNHVLPGKLPTWFTTVQPTKPASNPPFVMS